MNRLLDAPAAETAAVGLGREQYLGDEAITGGALANDPAVVHLAAFASAASRCGRR